MRPELIERLYQINRKFYTTFAAPFSETRSEPGRDLDRIVPYIPHGARVLDLGCGNGRVAALLARHQRSVTYVGVDWSEELIARCRTRDGDGSQELKATFWVADVIQPDWMRSLPLSAMEAFDCVLLLAVLHHIPGGDVRARILRQVRGLLSPQGRIIVSTWQFIENERMRKKIVPWSLVGIDERDLEPGDTLLDWKRGGLGLRYCHWIGEDELRVMAAQAGFAVTATFRAGGREENLSLYAVLSAS